MDAKEKFIEFLEAQELKYTKPREVIVGVFFNTKKHLSIDDLFALVKKQDKSIGYATVHRTLKLLKQAGLARELAMGEGRKLFEPALGIKHHDHLFCVKCGKLIEFYNQKIEQLQEGVAKMHKFKPIRHRMEIFGLCRECKR